MLVSSPFHHFEHARDVLRFATEHREPVALIILLETRGGAPRAAGAMMAVTKSGKVAGYLSGGCVDGDIKMRALSLLTDHENITAAEQVTYGEGAEQMDIVLPCGGRIEVMIIANPDKDILTQAEAALSARRKVGLQISVDGRLGLQNDRNLNFDFEFLYCPPLRIRVAGKGADLRSFVNLCIASGIEIRALTPEPDDLSKPLPTSPIEIKALYHERDIGPCKDDEWTAFVLMFHDREWEIPLLENALKGQAFFIGAVGSRRTHKIRRETLLEKGLDPALIERIYGPVGLIHGLRTASTVAISTLAQIIDVYHRNDQTL